MCVVFFCQLKMFMINYGVEVKNVEMIGNWKGERIGKYEYNNCFLFMNIIEYNSNVK